ncbi:curli-like amyloid fiber formation chaperone CsgH [Rhizobium miluonense]|uniref:CsgH-like domain-containing protein n=1 Tax=Rhizobium miluonense TaxID=411945 RepID=A0A1C3UZX3_9HYPH|nr:curli-like amyloid fiber formation chaperone CsgH [Rhizobium miluonense]SCB21043.1 hypothetical protein GA0061102_100791 [Rhizobium miluonense]
MVSSDRRISVVVAVTLAGLVAVGASAAVLDADRSQTGPVRCEIRDRTDGDTVFLEPLVHSDKDVSGTYSVSVSGGGDGGSSNIQQSGDFSVLAGRTASLGRMSVSAARASYDVKLRLKLDGTNVSCSKQATGTF